MSIATQERASSRFFSVSPWFSRLYAAIISARQKQADERIKRLLGDLQGVMIRRVKVPTVTRLVEATPAQVKSVNATLLDASLRAQLHANNSRR